MLLLNPLFLINVLLATLKLDVFQPLGSITMFALEITSREGSIPEIKRLPPNALCIVVTLPTFKPSMLGLLCKSCPYEFINPSILVTLLVSKLPKSKTLLYGNTLPIPAYRTPKVLAMFVTLDVFQFCGFEPKFCAPLKESSKVVTFMVFH